MRRPRLLRPGRSPAEALVRISIPFYGLMTAVSVAVLAWRGQLAVIGPAADSWWIREGLPGDIPGLLGVGLGLALVVVWVSRHSGEGPSSRFLEQRMQAALAGIRSHHALTLALLSGVGEELLFRGVLQTWLGEVLGTTGGWIVASLVFGAIHTGPDRRFLLWMTFSATVGLMLGALFLLTGSLLAPIAAHAGVNGLNLLVQAWQERMSGAPGRRSRA